MKKEMKNKVINSYVTESHYNKGMFIMVVECEDGTSYVVSGQHHFPTYLKRTEMSEDSPAPTGDKADGE